MKVLNAMTPNSYSYSTKFLQSSCVCIFLDHVNLSYLDVSKYSTGHFIMDFFEKSEKLKYLKNRMTHRKKFGTLVRKTDEDEYAKIAAFNFENCWRR